MFCRRLVLNAAAAVATLLALGAAAMAADMIGATAMHLRATAMCHRATAGHDKNRARARKAGRPVQVQAIVIGNPNIADASAINLQAIAITGKGAGLTNVHSVRSGRQSDFQYENPGR